MNTQDSLFPELLLIKLVPLARGLPTSELSYLSSEQVTIGNIVEVKVNNRKINGLVISVDKASTHKTELRNSKYELKKIERVLGQTPLSNEFMLAILSTASFFCCSIGNALASIVPSFVFTNHLADTKNSVSLKSDNQQLLKTDERIIQAPDDERISTYRSIIREKFARKNSVLICAPNIESVEELSKQLSRGIEDYIYTFHSDTKQASIETQWKKVLSDTHPVVIIGTGPYLSIPRHDIGAIIVERESDNWKQFARPHIDYRILAFNLSKSLGALLVYGDSVLSIETLKRFYDKEIQELAPIRQRSLSPTIETIIDLKNVSKFEQKNFQDTIISTELKNLIETLKENNERLILISSRKGLSPVTVCGDCNTTLRCNQCQVPLVLYKTGPNDTYFACTMCQQKYPSKIRCSHCNSWKLITVGIGIEKVVSLLESIYPDHKIFTLSGDIAKTRNKAREIVDKFIKSPGSIIVSTEMLFTYLHEQVENAAIVSIDSMFSIPDFKAYERMFHLLIRTKRSAKKQMIFQTTNPNERIFNHAMRGNILEFYREEISIRRKLQYPPFSLLIKISCEGVSSVIKNDIDFLISALDKYNPAILEPHMGTLKGSSRTIVVIRVRPNEWPKSDLVDILSFLPKNFDVNVMPENLL